MGPGGIKDAIKSAMAAHQRGDLAAAEAIYRQILSSVPDQPHALHYLGVLAHQRGDHAQAMELMQRSAALLPGVPEHHNNLGLVYQALGRLEDAQRSFQTAISLRNPFPVAQANLAHVLMRLGRIEQAVALYRAVLPANPDDAAIHYNLGRALCDLGQLDEALTHAARAVALAPKLADAHVVLGNIRAAQGELPAAIECYQAALRIDPTCGEIHGNIGGILRDQGRLDEAIAAFSRAVELRPDSAGQHSNLIYTMWFHPRYRPEEIFDAHGQWAQHHALPLVHEIRPAENDRSPERRLRIGLVSPDFRGHSVGRLIEPVLAHHDHANFEIILYSDVVAADELSRRIYACADQVHLTAPLDDRQLAELILLHRIDILIDLTLHMSGNRLLAFARKPAPVQMTYLGYCGTSGMDAMDYCLTDAQLDPVASLPPIQPGDKPGLASAIHSERLLHLPHCYWVYRPPEMVLDVSPSPSQRTGHTTFGSFNNFAKVTPKVIALWSKILMAVPDSRLLLVIRGGPAANPHVAKSFADCGIPADRLRILPVQSAAAYLQLHNEVDICLDPFPYNGGTTTLDCLYMGVPLVTLAGDFAVARAGATLLTAAG